MVRKLYRFLYIVLFLSPLFACAQPVANFSANVVSGCSPIVVQFSDMSTGTPTSWAWDLGNGSTSTVQNPSTTYITPGTYTISLIASNSGGSDTQTFTGYITVNPSPLVNFTADSTPACPPKTIVFNNLTTPGASGTTTYLWDFGDGQASSLANPSHTYTTAANFTVTLLVTNSAGCSQSLTKNGYIQLSAAPGANFTATNTNACSAPATTTFTNTSANATAYNWDFGDGQTSTSASPSHTYTATGTYNVRLVATNSTGCSDTLLQTAFVTIGALKSQFTVSDSTICIGDAVSFTNTSTPAPVSSSLWKFGTGATASTTNAAYIYTTAGTYTAKLIVQKNGCTDSSQHIITVSAKPVSQFTANSTKSCTVPFSTQFNNTSSGATSYFWIFGDGTTSTAANPSKTYNTAGIYTVKLVSINAAGCTDTMVLSNYIVIQPLTAGLFNDPWLNPPPGCAPATTTVFSNTSPSLLLPVTSYSWNFGDGQTLNGNFPSPTHTWASQGTYTLSVTYNTIPGCSYTKQTSFTIGSKPTASFPAGPDSVCPNTAVSFANNSTGGSSFLWNFGDGTTTNTVAPTHSYAASGNYTVTLIAFNSQCGDTLVRTNRVFVKLPTAEFVPSFNCSNRFLYTFTDNSVGANTYSWNFGDGQTSAQSGTVTHQYASYGTYTVTLIVTNTASGCSDSYAYVIKVSSLAPPFSADDTVICRNQQVNFSTTANTLFQNYTWRFGDGGTATGSNTSSHVYTTPGTYSVKLIITDTTGCKDSLTKNNYIQVGGPSVNFTASPTSGCAPLTTNFLDISTSNAGAITNRAWTFGDGSTLNTSAATASHIYNSGSYNVKLKVTDAIGCIDSLTKTGYISASKPVAGFFADDTTACAGQQVNFTNTSGGTGISELWHFGDGQTSTSYSTAHAYTSVGSYTVKLVITDVNGCKDSLIKPSYIQVQPLNIGFNMSDSFASCPPLAVNFTADTGLSNYSWTFGNSSISNLANPSTIYTYPGVYTVNLSAQNSVGCSDTASKTITILGPTGSFSYTPTNGCNPLTVNFTSINNNTSSLIWDMSNGVTQSTTSSSFSYTYTQSGKYVPKLILSDGSSCLVPIFGIDTIKIDSIGADFSFTPSSLCMAGTVQFTDTVYYSISNTATRSWTFGDGGTSTAHNPSHTYTTPGNYQVKLVISNNTGCTDTIIKNVIIHAQPNVNAGSNQFICLGQTTSVSLQATGASSYSWSPSAGLSCTSCANPSANPSVTTTYTVIGTDSNGCMDTSSVTVTIHTPPSVSGGGNQSICPGDSVQLLATGANTYSWSPATGLSCSACANPFAKPGSTATYIVTGTDANGCTDTGVVTVTVNAVPTVTASGNASTCAGDSVQLQAFGAVGYSWSPATGLSCTTCANPKASPSATNTYTVTGTNITGCKDTGMVTITVNPLPNVSAGSNKNICAGSNVQLQATGAVSYTWSPATGLSCTNCASPFASPSATTVYTVTGINANGCSDTGIVTVTVHAPPNVSAGSNQSICIGSTASLAATGASAYTWTPATGLSCTNCANPTATISATTTYTVTGIDANGCSDTGVVTITIKPQPTVSAGSNKTICTGGSVQLTATGAATYTWSPATGLSCTTCAVPTASPATNTTYSVIGSQNGCTDTAQVTVTVNSLPTISGGANQSICTGGAATLQATGGISYTWSPSAGLSCTTCASPTANPTTTTTYTVTGTNANGCSNTATVTVTVNPIPVVSATVSDDTICAGTNTTLQATGATTYVWNPAANLSCSTCATTTANPLNTTVYTVTGTTNGCSDTAQVKVTILPKPNIAASPDTAFCIGGSVQLHATGGQGYTWSPAAGLSCTSCTDPVANPSVTTVYTITGTNAAGCSNTATVTITVHQAPEVNAGEDRSLCSGSSVALQATGASVFTWTPSDDLSCATCSNPIAIPRQDKTYKVVGTDGFGCSDSDEVSITVIQKNPVSFSPDVSICTGVSAQLSASGGTSYQWIPATGLDNSNSNNPVATPTTTTVYQVIVKQGDCFADTGKIAVTVHGLPTVDAGPDQNAVAGNTVKLQALGTDIAEYLWTPSEKLSCVNCANPVADITKTTTYTVTVSNQWGCKAQDDVTVFVSCDPNQLFIANTFTPNGDGINDKFYPQGKGISTVQRFRVFNRWGEMVFDANNIPLNDANYGWDGTLNKAPLKPDVFVYIVNATCESGDPVEIKGDISLIR